MALLYCVFQVFCGTEFHEIPYSAGTWHKKMLIIFCHWFIHNGGSVILRLEKYSCLGPQSNYGILIFSIINSILYLSYTFNHILRESLIFKSIVGCGPDYGILTLCFLRLTLQVYLIFCCLDMYWTLYLFSN